MENDTTSPKAQIIKPVLLKAGVPLALSAAGFICARFLSRRSVVSCSPSTKTLVSPLETNGQEDEDAPSCLNSPLRCGETVEFANRNEQLSNSSESFQVENKVESVKETLELRCRIEELQEREWKLEEQFLRYRDLKEQETMLMELRNAMMLEMARMELLEKEVTTVEAENRRLQNLAAEHLRVLNQLEDLKSENGLLQRKVKALTRKTKMRSCLVREQNMKMKAREAELVRRHGELEAKNNDIKKLEDEVKELQMIINRSREEVNELVNQLNFTEQSSSSVPKDEGETVSMEEYNQLLNELDQLQKGREAEVKELTFLKWSNACLRHELMRIHENEDQNRENNSEPSLVFKGGEEIGEYGSEHDMDKMEYEHKDSCLAIVHGDRVCSKRRNLLKRFKRWVEGSEKMKGKCDDEKHNSKHPAGNSVSHGGEEHTPGRRSCSSA